MAVVLFKKFFQDWRVRVSAVIIVAIALGGLEAAWTGIGRGPTNVWLGVVSIFIVLFIVTFPKIWRIPMLAIIEEWTHIILGYPDIWLPTYNTIFNHWSHGLIGFPLMPWISFPVLFIVGEAVYQLMRKRGILQ